MFTGIIENLGKLTQIHLIDSGLKFTVEHPAEMAGTYTQGDSIAINGVCLTVVDFDDACQVQFDVSPETLEKTNLSRLTIGDKLHLEIPVSLHKPLGGHFVLGHVDEVLVVEQIKQRDVFTELTFGGVSHPEWVCEKGSIALDGVSLTINASPTNDTVECMIIPHTIENTRFADLKTGDSINVEYDYIAKIVAKNARRI